MYSKSNFFKSKKSFIISQKSIKSYYSYYLSKYFVIDLLLLFFFLHTVISRSMCGYINLNLTFTTACYLQGFENEIFDNKKGYLCYRERVRTFLLPCRYPALNRNDYRSLYYCKSILYSNVYNT